MRPFLPAAALALLLTGPGLPRTAAAGFGLFKNYWGNVVVATDMTEAGRALTPPTAESPVYYLGRSLGAKLGTITGDEMPDKQEMIDFVTKVLAKQGYAGAQPGVHEPTLYLVVQWGYLEPRRDNLLWFLGYHANQDIAAPAFAGRPGGPEAFLRHFRSRETEAILDGAHDPIYGIIVTAFDYKTARTPTPVICWQTRIGLPANGKSMAEALPTMLLAAGPAIGQQSDKPLLRDADSARAGRVDLGELQILDYDAAPAVKSHAGAKH